jgi:tetratricopeptide (TPR) repeat protein
MKIPNFKSQLSSIFVSIITVLFCSSLTIAAPAVREKIPSCRIYRIMARAYMAYGQFNKAMPLAEKALALAQQQDTPDQELANCLGDLAYIYNNLDRFTDAEQFCKLCIALQKKIYYDRHPFVAYSLRTLASIYQGQGKTAEAEEALQQAIDIMLESHPADDAVMAPFQVDFAKLLVVEGKLTEAEQCYDKAIKQINLTFGPEHLYSATVLGSLAELYTLQNRYSEAEPLINKSQAIQEKFYGPENHLIASLWLTKARICLVKGNTGEADTLIQKARNAIQKTGNTKEIARLEQKITYLRQAKPETASISPTRSDNAST